MKTLRIVGSLFLLLAILGLLLVASAFAVDLSGFNKDLLSSVQQQHNLTNESDEVQALMVDPSEEDMQDVARDELRNQANRQGSFANAVQSTAQPSDAQEKAFERDMAGLKPANPSTIAGFNSITNQPTNSGTNAAEAAMALWAATEATHDAAGAVNLNNIRIFAGEVKSCSYTKYLGVKDKFSDSCAVQVKSLHYYKCDDTGETYKDYNSCKNKCDNVCKKNTDASGPALEVAGIDITSLAGITTGHKELAAARKYGQCTYTGTSKDCQSFINTIFGGKKCTGVKYKYTENYCCYDSPTTQALSKAIKEQLRISTNSCTGITFQQFESVDFNDPKIAKVMEQQMSNVLDNTMMQDYTSKYQAQDAEDSSDNITGSLNIPKL